MEPSGTGERKILFVAECPGKEEDRQGKALIGEPGKLLTSTLKGLGFDIGQAKKTNAVICHPTKGELEPYMVSCCRPNLFKTIRDFQPNVIVPLGISALESLIGMEWKKGLSGLARWAGFQIPSSVHKAWICPTYHPSQVIAADNPVLQKYWEHHLAAAIRLEGKKPRPLILSELESRVECILDPKSARARVRDLSRKEGVLAFDYETTGLKPDRKEMRIVSCSFCMNGEDTFAFPMDDKMKGVLGAVLRNPALVKVASNLKFEERWSIAKIGHGVTGWSWDTMLAAHVLDNRREITSIKFLAFVMFGIADYSSHVSSFLESPSSNELNQIHKIPMGDLLMYNGLDSLLEYKVMEKQRRVFDER
jgi:DNA polymerase